MKYNDKDGFISNIVKVPYYGSSAKLIMNISFIGYEKTNLNKMIERRLVNDINDTSHDSSMSVPLINHKESVKKEKSLNEIDLRKMEGSDQITLDEKPIVLYDQSSNYSEGSISNNIITSAIYPDNPKVYIQKKGNACKEEDSSVLLSYHKESNTTLHYYAYKFYEEEEIAMTTYYCPFAICIMSYYPYHSSFKAIAMHLKQMITSFSLIPKEFFLYNIVNYLPSPVVCSMKCDLESNEGAKQSQLQFIYFKQLSGYPLIQYDLGEVIKVLSPEVFIEVFLLTFMEIDALFFSGSIEVLSIVMYTIANLNYPLNDSDYYGTISLLSLEEVIEENRRRMIGVNGTYDEESDLLLKKKTGKKEYCIVDIDKKNVKVVSEDNSIKEVFNYVSNIISKEKKCPISDMPFAKAVYELYQELKGFKAKENQLKQGMLIVPEFFLKPYEKELASLDKVNRIIQEAFYVFTIKIMALFYQNYNIIPPQKTSTFTLVYNEQDTIYNDEEKAFFALFKQSSKYNLFKSVYTTPNELSSPSIQPSLPLIFLEQFIYQFINNSLQAKPKPITQFFNAIDIFYEIEPSYTTIFDFKSFENTLSIPILKQINHNTISNDNNYLFFQNRFELLKFKSKKHRIKLASIYSLNASNYLNYHHYLENLSDEELNLLFPFNTKTIKAYEIQQLNFNDQIFLSYKKKSNNKRRLCKFQLDKSKLKLSDMSLGSYMRIEEAIEGNLINQKVIDKNEVIIVALIIFYAVTRKSMKGTQMKYDHFDLLYNIIFLKRNSVICRHMITLLIISFIKEIQLSIQSNSDYSYEQKCLGSLIFLLIKLRLLPNKELLSYLNWAYQTKLIDGSLFTSKDLEEYSKFSLCPFVIENKGKGSSPIELSKKKSKNFLKYNLAADKERKYAGYFLTLAEINHQFNGNYNVHFVTQEIKAKMQTLYQNTIDKEKTTWVIRSPTKQFTTFVYSPMKIYSKCTNLINSILSEPSIIINDKAIIKNLSSNFIFYIENIPNILQQEHDILLIKDYLLDFLYTILSHTQL